MKIKSIFYAETRNAPVDVNKTFQLSWVEFSNENISSRTAHGGRIEKGSVLRLRLIPQQDKKGKAAESTTPEAIFCCRLPQNAVVMKNFIENAADSHEMKFYNVDFNEMTFNDGSKRQQYKVYLSDQGSIMNLTTKKQNSIDGVVAEIIREEYLEKTKLSYQKEKNEWLSEKNTHEIRTSKNIQLADPLYTCNAFQISSLRWEEWDEREGYLRIEFDHPREVCDLLKKCEKKNDYVSAQCHLRNLNNFYFNRGLHPSFNVCLNIRSDFRDELVDFFSFINITEKCFTLRFRKCNDYRHKRSLSMTYEYRNWGYSNFKITSASHCHCYELRGLCNYEQSTGKYSTERQHLFIIDDETGEELEFKDFLERQMREKELETGIYKNKFRQLGDRLTRKGVYTRATFSTSSYPKKAEMVEATNKSPLGQEPCLPAYPDNTQEMEEAGDSLPPSYESVDEEKVLHVILDVADCREEDLSLHGPAAEVIEQLVQPEIGDLIENAPSVPQFDPEALPNRCDGVSGVSEPVDRDRQRRNDRREEPPRCLLLFSE